MSSQSEQEDFDSEGDSSEIDSDSEWSHEDDEDNEVHQAHEKRSILWLCHEGQIDLAFQRFEKLLEDGTTDSTSIELLRKEIFQVARDKNYALHELLMGGTSDATAFALTLCFLDFAKDYPLERTRMLLCMPPSHGRTPLHWATWSNSKIEILKALVQANPEALLMRDKRIHGARTPLEILKRYCSGRDIPNKKNSRIQYLEKAMSSWISHRVRLMVLLCTNRFFGKQSMALIPFDKTDRLNAKMKPRPWFVLSVIGFLLQREMKPLAMKILTFVGGNAKIQSTRPRNKAPFKKQKL